MSPVYIYQNLARTILNYTWNFMPLKIKFEQHYDLRHKGICSWAEKTQRLRALAALTKDLGLILSTTSVPRDLMPSSGKGCPGPRWQKKQTSEPPQICMCAHTHSTTAILFLWLGSNHMFATSLQDILNAKTPGIQDFLKLQHKHFSSHFLWKNLKTTLICSFICWRKGTHVREWVVGSQRATSRKFLCYHVEPRSQTQVIRLGSNCLYWLNHLASQVSHLFTPNTFPYSLTNLEHF